MLAKAIDPERIESIKAGIIAAGIGSTVSIAFIGCDYVLMETGLLPPEEFIPKAIQRVAVAAVCCFLFGVTYRYIVRQDSNPHLRSGAVGAFALTRGLSQLESTAPSDLLLANLLPLVMPLVESFGLFLTVRLMLDLGLKQKWLKPFTNGAGQGQA